MNDRTTDPCEADTPPDVDWRSEPESRLIDRRCRCGRLAAVNVPDCGWHASVSARYAADLLASLAAADKETEHAKRAAERWARMYGALHGIIEPLVIEDEDSVTALRRVVAERAISNV